MKLSSVIGQYINKYKMMKPNELAELAKGGDAEAQYELGKRLYAGKGIKKSYELARQWFEAGAEQGHVGCCYEYALMLTSGTGGDADDARAAEFFKKAADGGDIQAMFELGAMYSQGRGVKKNYVKAMRYLRMARQLPAASALLDDAINWWRPAAEARIPEGEYWYGVCLINGYGASPDDGVMGYNWIYQAALSDHPKAIDAMAQIYENGINVPRDPEKAKFWRNRYREVTGKTVSGDASFRDENAEEGAEAAKEKTE